VWCGLALLARSQKRIKGLVIYMLSTGASHCRVWDLASGQLKATLAGHTEPLTSVAISQDGATLVSGSDDNTVRWEATGVGWVQLSFMKPTAFLPQALCLWCGVTPHAGCGTWPLGSSRPLWRDTQRLSSQSPSARMATLQCQGPGITPSGGSQRVLAMGDDPCLDSTTTNMLPSQFATPLTPESDVLYTAAESNVQ
jgi:hypothetical protein